MAYYHVFYRFTFRKYLAFLESKSPIDGIFVANESSKSHLLQMLKKDTPVHPMGIPLSCSTNNGNISLKQRQQILITGGGWALGPIDKIVEAILKLDQVLKIVVVCGSNDALKKLLAESYIDQIKLKRLEVVGMVEDMTNYYRRARVLLTKAGGVSLTEAAKYEVPIVITPSLPGHEEGNRELFIQAEACSEANTPEEAAYTIANLLKDQAECEKKVYKATKLINPNSTSMIVSKILEEMGHVDA